MQKGLTAVGAVLAVLTTVVGTTLAIDSRYAKSQEVQQQFLQARKQQLRDRIFELDLKAQQTPADKALREYLMRQLQDSR
jgi:type II secretory pathway pseudopilin PulG